MFAAEKLFIFFEASNVLLHTIYMDSKLQMFITFHFLELIKLDQMSAYIRRSDAGQRGVGATKQTGYDSLPGCFITVCMFYLPVRFAPSY